MGRPATGKMPRIYVSLKPETYEVIKECADAVGASMSSVIAEIMDEAAPSLRNVQKAAQMAKTKPREAFDLLAEQLAIAQHTASQAQLDLHETKHSLKRKAVKHAKST